MGRGLTPPWLPRGETWVLGWSWRWRSPERARWVRAGPRAVAGTRRRWKERWDSGADPRPPPRSAGAARARGSVGQNTRPFSHSQARWALEQASSTADASGDIRVCACIYTQPCTHTSMGTRTPLPGSGGCAVRPGAQKPTFPCSARSDVGRGS